MTEPEEWHARALCREVWPDLWYPEKSEHTARDAKKICLSCEVRLECLQYALDNNERYGVWGGMSERERARVLRRRRAA
jgi:WhiB family redox-sensing transcriptional regulator